MSEGRSPTGMGELLAKIENVLAYENSQASEMFRELQWRVVRVGDHLQVAGATDQTELVRLLKRTLQGRAH